MLLFVDQVMNNYFLIISLFLSFCSDPGKLVEPPIGVVDMKQILKDRHWFFASNSYSLTQTDSIYDNTDSVLSSFHKSLGYTDLDFQQSWDYYLNQNNKELLIMYENILQDFQLESDQLKN